MARPVWTTKTILNRTKQYFGARGIENPRLDAEVLLCAVLRCSRLDLFLDLERPLDDKELSLYRDYVTRRGSYEPLAYILGSKAFMRNELEVNAATLVPRPETELLVESVIKAAKILNPEGGAKILDLGTGSGAIIVSLLDYLSDAKGVGTDVSVDALTVARKNAERLGVLDRAGFVRSDLFRKLPLDKKFDIIVSNPPYIPSADIEGLAEDVKKEPRLALDGGEDGLYFYREIAKEAVFRLAERGLLALEVGIGQSTAVERLCLEGGFDKTAIRKDYAGIDRMVFAFKGTEGERGCENLLLEITR